MPASPEVRPWAALWSLVLGFFMILVDTTIVSVANPMIMRSLDTTMTATLWATSAYLLAYAVPLLITGRLGDRFGPKRMYLFGLVLFTLASLVCGLAPSIEWLIVARVFQGLGASFMSPQTMTVVTRIFAPNERGSAMAVWGVTAGVALLVGPILGGLLLGALGWEWIFFINVPVGIVGFWLAYRYVPSLSTSAHRFDLLGVALSAVGTFLIVFGIQEGQDFEWGMIWGPITVWGLIITGIVVIAVFVWWQYVLEKRGGEPLLPLGVLRDRNFALGASAIVLVGLTTTSLGLPLMFFLQVVRGFTPAQSALLLLPMAIMAMVLARPVGKLIDRRDPRRIATGGLVMYGLGALAYVPLANEATPVWLLLAPGFLLGTASAFMWGPLATIATYNLSREFAGAGSGVYNTARQVGAVLGAAAMAMLMQARLADTLGAEVAGTDAVGSGVLALPPELRPGYALAMGQSLLLPITTVFIAAVLTLAFAARPRGERVTVTTVT